MPRRLRATHTVDVLRREDDPDDAGVETNAIGEVVETDTGDGRWQTIAEGVPFAFDDGGTAFVREQSGERVEQPATGTLYGDADVRENDRLDISGVGTLRVTGVERTYDRRTSDVVSISVDLEDR